MTEKPIIGYYGFWVRLTYLSAVSAAFGIYFAFNGSIQNAMIFLMISGICDTLDGRVASLKKRDDRELSYGIQIDALADLVSFGVFPAIIGYVVWSSAGSLGLLYTSVAALYILTALIRLAYFNVIEAELHSKNEKRLYYEGLPVTSVSLLIPVVFSVCHIFDIPFSSIYSVLLIIISALFILRIKIPKPRGRAQIALCLCGIPTIIYLILADFAVVFWC